MIFFLRSKRIPFKIAHKINYIYRIFIYFPFFTTIRRINFPHPNKISETLNKESWPWNREHDTSTKPTACSLSHISRASRRITVTFNSRCSNSKGNYADLPRIYTYLYATSLGHIEVTRAPPSLGVSSPVQTHAKWYCVLRYTNSQRSIQTFPRSTLENREQSLSHRFLFFPLFLSFKFNPGIRTPARNLVCVGAAINRRPCGWQCGH